MNEHNLCIYESFYFEVQQQNHSMKIYWKGFINKLWLNTITIYGIRNSRSILGSWALPKSFILLSSSSRIYFNKENAFFRIVYL